MSILSRLFAPMSREEQKETKFRKFEKEFVGKEEMISLMKATWLTSRGNHYGQQGKLDDAEADFKEALRIRADHVPAHVSLGLVYREKGMLQEALTTLNRAPRKRTLFGKERGGNEFELYNAIASVYLLMGNKDKTIQYAKKALLAVDDPERKEKIEIEKRIGAIDAQEDEDSQMIETLKGLIQELEGE